MHNTKKDIKYYRKYIEKLELKELQLKEALNKELLDLYKRKMRAYEKASKLVDYCDFYKE